MKHEARSVGAAIITVLASLPWGGILTFGSALLGSAGSAMATVVTGWLSPVLLCASILLMGRSFYVIYVKKISSRTTVVITWCAFAFMVGFWTWYLLLGGSECIRELFKPDGSGFMVRACLGVALGCVLLAGCGGAAGKKAPSPGMSSVTLHVEQMRERLNLTGLTGPNKVHEALSGLPGVEWVDVDLDNDRLRVDYDPGKLSPEQMLETVGKQGFTATIVAGDTPP